MPFSIAILAGGKSKRMGQNKALIPLGEQPVLQHVINAVQGLSADLFLVTNTPDIYRSFKLPMVPDVIPGKAALGGIYTALKRARHNWTLVLACDMPLLNPTVIGFLARQRRNTDVVIPLIEKHPEALHAFYSKSCLPAIENYLQSDNLKVIGFFKEVRVTYIGQSQLQEVTPNLNFLINLNTPADLDRVKQIFTEKTKK